MGLAAGRKVDGGGRCRGRMAGLRLGGRAVSQRHTGMGAGHDHARQSAGRVTGHGELRPQQRHHREERQPGTQAVVAQALHRGSTLLHPGVPVGDLGQVRSRQLADPGSGGTVSRPRPSDGVKCNPRYGSAGKSLVALLALGLGSGERPPLADCGPRQHFVSCPMTGASNHVAKLATHRDNRTPHHGFAPCAASHCCYSCYRPARTPSSFATTCRTSSTALRFRTSPHWRICPARATVS